MKDSRIGESLWFIWEGEGYVPTVSSPVVFYTEGHVDTEEEVVRRALASSLQREGIALSLSEGFNMIHEGRTWQGYIGMSPVLNENLVCDSDGDTEDGYRVYEVVPVTWVEVSE